MSATTNPQAGRSPKQTHTPGPWKVRVIRFRHARPDQEPMSHVEYRAEDGWRRLTLHMRDGDAERLAATINATTALVEAACQVADGIAGAMGEDRDAMRWVNKLRAAIAKAEGKS